MAEFSQETFSAIKALALAMAGGIAKYLNEYLNGRKFHSGHFLAQSVVSGFTGYLAFLFMGRTYPEFASIASGVCGFGGAQLLNFLLTLWKRRLEREMNGTESK